MICSILPYTIHPEQKELHFGVVNGGKQYEVPESLIDRLRVCAIEEVQSILDLISNTCTEIKNG